MRQKDIVVGKVYEARVSGRLVPLLVLRGFEKSAIRYGRIQSTRYVYELRFECQNLDTDRVITLRASRLRRLHPQHNLAQEVSASEASLLRAQGVA